MSILQEYEVIRKILGEEEYLNICEFLKENPEYYLSDIYYNVDNAFENYKEWKLRRENL